MKNFHAALIMLAGLCQPVLAQAPSPAVSPITSSEMSRAASEAASNAAASKAAKETDAAKENGAQPARQTPDAADDAKKKTPEK